MHGREPRSDLSTDLQREPWIAVAFLEFVERNAIDVFHDQIHESCRREIDVQDLHDVWVPQGRCDLCLTSESSHDAGVRVSLQNLDREQTFIGLAYDLVDRPHAAVTQKANDSVPFIDQ